jgi:aromatase
MPRIEHSVEIRRPPREVFEITNDIDTWHVLFDEYTQSQVLSREHCGRFTRLVFRLKNKEGNEWQSWRLLDHERLEAIAEREKPLYPFKYMHLKWRYDASGDGTLMTWTQDFEMDPRVGVPEAIVAERMDAHGVHNQERIKALLEAVAVRVLAAQWPATG